MSGDMIDRMHDAIQQNPGGFLDYMLAFSSYTICPRSPGQVTSREHHEARLLVHWSSAEYGFVCSSIDDPVYQAHATRR